jgi:putative radical SAM enzyme (TIGR03279 family)
VLRPSPAWQAGLRKGDSIFSVNEEPVGDELDFVFLSAAPHLQIGCRRKGQVWQTRLSHQPPQDIGLSFARRPVSRCGNRCLFCFVDQMPPGMRRSLYIKDEDFRHSFLYGNYITLTCLPERDLQAIIRLRLTPLYISVHVTDPELRRKMLGHRRAPAILEQLNVLQRAGISFHTQIVVCPGLNDGPVLIDTVRSLLALGKGLLSIAVVPVGLTRFHRGGLIQVDQHGAAEICMRFGQMSDADTRRTGFRRLFLSDEFLIKASLPIPHRAYYEDFAQIENGVGLVRTLLDEWETVRKELREERVGPSRGVIRKRTSRRFLILTSRSAVEFLRQVAGGLTAICPEMEFDVVAVENRVFGESVTVAGLMTAADIVRTLRAYGARAEAVFVPGVIFNHNHVTLDGYSLSRLQRASGIPVHVADNLTQLAHALFPMWRRGRLCPCGTAGYRT